MSILFQINVTLNAGSIGRISEQIGKMALSKGWKSYIAYGRSGQKSESISIKIGSIVSILYHVIQTRLFDRHGLASVYSTKKLIKTIKIIKPDIIHLHNIHGYYINYPLLFSFLSKSKIPVVWTMHDCWALTGHCAFFDYIGCDKWKSLCFSCPQYKNYPTSLFFDKSTKNYKIKKKSFNSVDNLTIVPVSYWLGDIVKQSFLKTHSVNVIQNGIDTEVFKPRSDIDIIKNKLKLEGGKIILGVAGVWEERKGLKYFVKLRALFPKNISIILIGLNNDQIKKLPHNIIGINRTENVNELAQFYSLADVFVNPTLEDTFPTTNLESLACGTPVVTFATGGSVESISDSVGLIAQKGDINDLFMKVNEVLDNGKKKYSENCRVKACLSYNRDKQFLNYLSLYEKLLKI